METKLFNIPAEKRNVVLYLETYKGNRIAIKLLKYLKAGDKFFINDVGGMTETRIFEVSIFTNLDFEDIIAELKVQITDWMRNETPENYLFDFTQKRLGFINSFNVFSNDGFHIEVCHKIKENRTNGGTTIPANKITI